LQYEILNSLIGMVLLCMSQHFCTMGYGSYKKKSVKRFELHSYSLIGCASNSIKFNEQEKHLQTVWTRQCWKRWQT